MAFSFRQLKKKFGNQVLATVHESERYVELTGVLTAWQDVLEACSLCVIPKNGWHVVNHIRLAGYEPSAVHLPAVRDLSLDGEKVDVLIIGGGICGASIARELSRYQLSILLVEKESDLATGASCRNDGEVHPGVDQSHPTLKLHYELLGNALYPEVSEELGIPFRRVGQYVAFRSPLFCFPLLFVAAQRRRIGVKDTRVIGKKKLYEAQPHLPKGYHFALYNSSAGITCPYGLTIAYGENAIQNGCRISLNTAVLDMEWKDGEIRSVRTNRGTVYPKMIINAAGVFSDQIAAMAHDEFFSIHPRRGTELVLDHKVACYTSSIVSCRDISSFEKRTKGGGVLRTVDGNILIGPDAVETPEREDFSTDRDSISSLLRKHRGTIPELSQKDIITYFTGVRASTFEEDFIIEKGRMTRNIFHCAGIQSPGLTAAPAIARDVAEKVVAILGDVPANPDFNPLRRVTPPLKDLPEQERNSLIQKNPDYGIIVCRCEEISRGEILDALKRPLCVPTVDGIKRRVRPGMGRCQGGFCGPVVTKIIADFLQSDLDQVTKNGNGSFITKGGTK